jgi:predicted nucleic acid-binding protein
VIDANLGLGLVLHLPYSESAYRLLKRFQEDQEELAVPTLWEYECISGLRAAIYHNHIEAKMADLAVQVLLAIEPKRINPTPTLHRSAMLWAERLGQNKAYDAQYIALAESLGADFWSADQRLINTLKAQGAGWAHWIGEV